MTSDFTLYLIYLALFIIGFFIIKKVASCIIRIVVAVIIVAIIAAIYMNNGQ
ncbi:MAG: sulfate transporter [Prevotella sp.]|nr:sulfate transporter [Prevotella sp.]